DYLKYIQIDSLNRQTLKNFNVIIYHQSRKEHIKPFLDYTRKLDLDIETFQTLGAFFGKYSCWSIFQDLERILKTKEVNEYFIVLHAEEFLEKGYVEKLMKNLAQIKFKPKVIFGNLIRIENKHIQKISDYDELSKRNKLILKPWSKSNVYLNPKNRKVSEDLKIPKDYPEDIFFMDTKFCLETDFFCSKINNQMLFEDIHPREVYVQILSKLNPKNCLKFKGSYVYHLQHKIEYYQYTIPEVRDKLKKLISSFEKRKDLQEQLNMADYINWDKFSEDERANLARKLRRTNNATPNGAAYLKARYTIQRLLNIDVITAHKLIKFKNYQLILNQEEFNKLGLKSSLINPKKKKFHILKKILKF
ncbi:hypothetical protein KY332_04220, partial [Candidatus Woesearchaeota archaeon]|nr:hypothetical protein [Candidatus Woesearchaeota archaeon]